MAIKTTIQLRRDTYSAWYAANPVLAAGEIALVDKNNAYGTGSGEPLWVVRIGDGSTEFRNLPETAYALRSELTALGDEVILSAKTYTNEVSTALSTDYVAKDTATLTSAKEYTDTVSAALCADYYKQADNALTAAKAYTDVVSAYLDGKIEDSGKDLSDAITALSDALTAEAQVRATVDTALSAAISGKVKIEGESVDYVNFDRVNAEEYHNILTGGTIDPKTIYIVSSDNINAFGEKIINVGDATDLSDAVNLKQLNAAKGELTSLVSSVSATLQGEIDDLESGASALVSAVSAELTGIINSVSTDLEGQITSVSSALNTKIDTVSGDLTTLVNTTKEGLEERDTFISGLINTVSTDLDTLETTVGTLRTDFNSVSTDLDAFKTQTGNNFSYVSGVVDDTIEDLGELSGKVEALSTASEVGVSALGRTGDTYKYAILQGGVSKGEIEVPYDVFVDKGELSTIGGKTYLLLTLNNAASSVISIEVDSLVDVYTGLTSDTVAVDVDSFQISAAVLDGSIDTAKLADDAVTTAKIVDGNVTTDKLAADAVTNAKLADDAVQTENILSGAVTTAKIADANVTPAKLDPNGVFVFDCGGAANS